MKSITFSHKGKRESNQDYILCKTIGPDRFLFLIAVGMGGYEDGDIAAQIVAESIAGHITENFDSNPELQDAINSANSELNAVVQESGKKSGATVAGIVLNDETAICFWVGDVKVFHFRNRKLVFESKSHSLLNEILESGSIRASFRAEKYKHVVTRSIQGDLDRSEIDTHRIENVSDSDLFILCSDGVSDVLSGIEMEGMYKGEEDFSTFVKIVEMKTVERSKDNSSLIALTQDYGTEK